MDKWVSKSRALLLSLTEEDCAKEGKDLDLDQDMSVDLNFNSSLGKNNFCIVGIASSIHDPLGI